MPLGAAACAVARAGQGVGGVVRAGALTGAATNAASGAGHDEGSLIDRLDGAATGALEGVIGGAISSGAGVLIARDVSRMRIWARAKPLEGAAARRAQFGNAWPSGSLSQSINRFAGPNPIINVTNNGKRIYENPNTVYQVVEDIQGGCFRIFDPSLPGKRRYLDLDGNIPNNKFVRGRQVGRTQAEYNQVTHFRID